MNRRQFLHTTAWSALGLSLFPNLLWAEETAEVLYTKDELMGFTQLPKILGYHLRQEVAEAFIAMKTEANAAGIHPMIFSGFRSFNHQKLIWNKKYNQYIKRLPKEETIQKVIEFSTIPGTSRHHWGTDFDLIDARVARPSGDPLLEKHFAEGGRYFALKQWLNENAERFGFYEVYTKDMERTGIAYEPWHFSYQPVAKKMLQSFLQLNLKENLQQNSILGNDHFTEEFITKYTTENILNINKNLI